MRECLIQEVRFRTSRSSGPGGQHVNKTESRVELLWSLHESACLKEVQKIRVSSRLGKRINEEGMLILDFLTPEEKLTVWRGIARGVLPAKRTPGEVEAIINDAVKAVLDNYPPPPEE